MADRGGFLFAPKGRGFVAWGENPRGCERTPTLGIVPRRGDVVRDDDGRPSDAQHRPSGAQDNPPDVISLGFSPRLPTGICREESTFEGGQGRPPHHNVP